MTEEEKIALRSAQAPLPRGPYVWPRLKDIDWLIWEPLATAHIVEGDDLVLMRPEHWESLAIRAWCADYSHVLVEVGRYDSVKSLIRVPASCTVRELLTAIYDFYQSEVPNEDAIADVSEHDYKDKVVKDLRAGRKPRMYELNGAEGYVSPVDEGYRRHPFMCIGCVRFEGVRRLSDDVFEMYLGS